MEFEWDTNKNEVNIKKHGISFEEAQLVFDDPLNLSKLEKEYDFFEERWITIGTTTDKKIIVVAHLYFIDNREEVIRIISARRPTTKERKYYETYE